MEKNKINIQKEIAIIFRKKIIKKRTHFIPIKVVEGHFDYIFSNFVDTTGNQYLHLIANVVDTETENEEEAYLAKGEDTFFAGRLAITEELEKSLSISFEEYKANYLKKYQEYDFKIIKGDIISIHKESRIRSIYSDDTLSLVEKVQETIDILEESFGVAGYLRSSQTSVSTDNNEPQSVITGGTSDLINETPKVIVDKVKELVKGQDEAVVEIVTNIYKRYKFPNSKKNNMLIIGPSGVGKTYVFEVLSKLLNIPITVFSVPGLTQAGYKGEDIENILERLVMTCNKDISLAEHGIIILDEIDKIANKSGGEEGGKIATEAVQNELLKVLEGTTKIIRVGDSEAAMDTSNILFIGVGAFQKLHEEPKHKTLGFGNINQEQTTKQTKTMTEDLVGYGIKREFIGRLPIVTKFKQLSEEDLCNIIYSKASELTKNIEILKECGITITNVEEVVKNIAKDAINKNIGARGLSQTLAKMFQKIFYDVFNNIGVYNELTLGKNIINDNSDYELSKDKYLKSSVKEKKLTITE